MEFQEFDFEDRILAAESTAWSFVRLALNAGGPDNTSVCIVRIKQSLS